jgi:polar amino acid transport system substrate-binding protein
MKKLIALLVALTMVLVNVAALAETVTLKAGTSPDFPPFEALDDAGNVIGFDADLAAAIGAVIGAEIVFEPTSFDSIVTGVQTGLYDLGISGFYITEERLANVDFSVPYLQDSQSAIVKVDSDITDNASLMGKKIGSQSGTIGLESAEASTDEGNVFAYTKALDAVMDLKGSKLDVVITDTPVAKKILAELNDPTLTISETVSFGVEYYGIALPKGQDELKAKINAAIEALIADGTIDELVTKWEIYGAADDAE